MSRNRNGLSWSIELIDSWYDNQNAECTSLLVAPPPYSATVEGFENVPPKDAVPTTSQENSTKDKTDDKTKEPPPPRVSLSQMVSDQLCAHINNICWWILNGPYCLSALSRCDTRRCYQSNNIAIVRVCVEIDYRQQTFQRCYKCMFVVGKAREKENQFCHFQFRFADCIDVILMIAGTICAMGHGAAMPGLMVILGKMTDSFILDNPACDPNSNM